MFQKNLMTNVVLWFLPKISLIFNSWIFFGEYWVLIVLNLKIENNSERDNWEKACPRLWPVSVWGLSHALASLSNEWLFILIFDNSRKNYPSIGFGKNWNGIFHGFFDDLFFEECTIVCQTNPKSKSVKAIG